MFNKLIKIAVVECLNRTRQTFEASCIQNRLPFSFDTLRLSEIERKNKKLEMFSQTQSRTKGTTAKRSSRIPPLPQKTTATDLEPSSKTSLFLGIIITTTNSCESTNTQSCLPAFFFFAAAANQKSPSFFLLSSRPCVYFCLIAKLGNAPGRLATARVIAREAQRWMPTR